MKFQLLSTLLVLAMAGAASAQTNMDDMLRNMMNQYAQPNRGPAGQPPMQFQRPGSNNPFQQPGPNNPFQAPGSNNPFQQPMNPFSNSQMDSSMGNGCPVRNAMQQMMRWEQESMDELQKMVDTYMPSASGNVRSALQQIKSSLAQVRGNYGQTGTYSSQPNVNDFFSHLKDLIPHLPKLATSMNTVSQGLNKPYGDLLPKTTQPFAGMDMNGMMQQLGQIPSMFSGLLSQGLNAGLGMAGGLANMGAGMAGGLANMGAGMAGGLANQLSGVARAMGSGGISFQI